MRFLISILFFYLNNALAFEPHIAKYQLSINGFKIAEEVRTLHKLEDRYFYTANAKTSGVAALIKDYSIAASSAFSINDNDVNSIHYQKTNNHTLDINGQSLMTIKVSMLDNNDNNIQAYFSPKHQYLPVLIEQTKQGRKYQYQLVDLEIEQPSEDQLQVSF